MKVLDWVNDAATRLGESGVTEARLEAQILAAAGLAQTRAWLMAHGDEPLAIDQESNLAQMLARRITHEPLAYIVGYREFYGRRFEVNRSVLIPRQETEVLVESVLAEAKAGQSVLDVGTGSGCIAITLKLERPELLVSASDISGEALRVAQNNSATLGASVDFQQSDLLEAWPGQVFDWIVSNPPYVAWADPLAPEVRDFEPQLALFGGEDGLEVYRRLASDAKKHLTDKGRLVMEIGFGQGPEITEIFQSQGWQRLESKFDLAGIERVLGFEAKPQK